MKLANRVNEKLGHCVSCEMGGKRPKMGSFGETIHYSHDNCDSLRIGKADNEIQSQILS